MQDPSNKALPADNDRVFSHATAFPDRGGAERRAYARIAVQAAAQEPEDSDLYDVERNPLDALILPGVLALILLAGLLLLAAWVLL